MKYFIFLILACSLTASVLSQQPFYDSISVRIRTLDAKSINNIARLEWQVVCFLEYAVFDIQRSANGTNYTTINSFEADQLRCRQPFAYIDSAITGKNFYRIRVGDRDGHYYHSKVVAVTGKHTSFEINTLTPSIVINRASLSISSATPDNAEIKIYNFNGKVVKVQAANLYEGITELAIDMTNFVSGNYILTIKNKFSEIKTIRFVRQ